MKKILEYSLPLAPYFFMGFFASGAVDAIFLSTFLTTKDLGHYSVALLISGVALQLPTLANGLLLPFFVSLLKESQTPKTNRYFEHSLPSFTLGWGFLCSVAALAAYFLIPLVFGAEFQASTLPLWILLANSTMNLPILLGYGSLSNATATTYIAMISAFLMAGVNLGLNYLLIPLIGLEGCAWATSMVYLVTAVTFAVLLRRAVKMPISWTFLALTPSFLGSLAISLTRNPWLSFCVCGVLTGFLAILKRQSFNETFIFMRKLWPAL